MIKIFEFRNGGSVIPTGHCYHIEPLRIIIEEEYQDCYGKVLLYIHYMTSMIESENPYFNIPIQRREEMLKGQMKIEFRTQCPYILEAIEVISEMQETSAARAYKAMSNTFDRISVFLNEQYDLTTGRDGNIKDILATAEKFDKIRAGFKNAYADLKEEQSHGWGDKEIPYDQM